MSMGRPTAISIAGLLALAFAAASAGGTETDADGDGYPGAVSKPPATCFWEGPISTKRKTTRGFDGRYFNFPEESATYWLARLNLPAGSRLVLRGRFPHGRYMSLNSYSDGAPTDSLSDIAIEARPQRDEPVLRRGKARRAQARLARPGPERASPGPGEPRAEHALRRAGPGRGD